MASSESIKAAKTAFRALMLFQIAIVALMLELPSNEALITKRLDAVENMIRLMQSPQWERGRASKRLAMASLRITSRLIDHATKRMFQPENWQAYAPVSLLLEKNYVDSLYILQPEAPINDVIHMSRSSTRVYISDPVALSRSFRMFMQSGKSETRNLLNDPFVREFRVLEQPRTEFSIDVCVDRSKPTEEIEAFRRRHHLRKSKNNWAKNLRCFTSDFLTMSLPSVGVKKIELNLLKELEREKKSNASRTGSEAELLVLDYWAARQNLLDIADDEFVREFGHMTIGQAQFELRKQVAKSNEPKGGVLGLSLPRLPFLILSTLACMGASLIVCRQLSFYDRWSEASKRKIPISTIEDSAWLASIGTSWDYCASMLALIACWIALVFTCDSWATESKAISRGMIWMAVGVPCFIASGAVVIAIWKFRQKVQF